jgi:hypothetical protein
MDFRWVIGITLWTMLIGPVFGPPAPAAKVSNANVSAAPDHPAPPK